MHFNGLTYNKQTIPTDSWRCPFWFSIKGACRISFSPCLHTRTSPPSPSVNATGLPPLSPDLDPSLSQALRSSCPEDKRSSPNSPSPFSWPSSPSLYTFIFITSWSNMVTRVLLPICAACRAIWCSFTDRLVSIEADLTVFLAMDSVAEVSLLGDLSGNVGICVWTWLCNWEAVKEYILASITGPVLNVPSSLSICMISKVCLFKCNMWR